MVELIVACTQPDPLPLAVATMGLVVLSVGNVIFELLLQLTPAGTLLTVKDDPEGQTSVGPE